MAIKHILRNNVLTLRLLIGATTVSIIAILSIVSFLLVREHRTAELAAIRTSLNIVQLIGRDVQNTVDLYDSALNTLIDVSKRSDLSSVSQPLQHMLLFDKAEQTPANGGFYLLNDQGDLVADSRTLAPPKSTSATGQVLWNTVTPPVTTCLSPTLLTRPKTRACAASASAGGSPALMAGFSAWRWRR
ncbi:hypothetical protein [Pseudomonas fragi]|uniref:hypothetical protein n=1 Tax=Pseudomonas fragi TaxID=296 RepID=UPI0030B8A922